MPERVYQKGNRGLVRLASVRACGAGVSARTGGVSEARSVGMARRRAGDVG